MLHINFDDCLYRRKTGKTKVINFVNRTYQNIIRSYMALKERYKANITFNITENRDGVLIGYFQIG